jgi:hypothetical protein
MSTEAFDCPFALLIISLRFFFLISQVVLYGAILVLGTGFKGWRIKDIFENLFL